MKSKHSLDAACRDRLNELRNFRHGILRLVALICLLPLIGMVIAGSAHAEPGVMAAGVGLFGPLCLMGGLRDKESGNADGGGDVVLDPVAKKILDRIDEHKKTMADIEVKLGELKETKGDAEELHKAMKEFDGLGSDFKTVAQKMAQMETKLANVRREVTGDPLQRMTRDPEMRTLINAPAKVALLVKRGKPVPKELADAAERMDAIINGKAVLGTSTPGSNYIDDELISSVYQLVSNYGKWSGFDILRPGARTVKLPVDTTDPTMIWMTEGTAPSEASYAGTQVTLNIKTLFGWIGVSNELLEDDEIGLASHLATKFARATSKKIDHACFVADGTNDATHGDYEGIFGFGTSYGVAAGNVSIATLDFEDFVGLIAGADEALVESPTSRWWMHPQVLVQLLKIKDGNLRPIFLTGMEAPAAGGIGSILGYPVVTANMAPKVDGISKPLAAFGDANGLAVALRKDMEFASSSEALFTANSVAFRQVARVGTKIKAATAFEILTTAAE